MKTNVIKYGTIAAVALVTIWAANNVPAIGKVVGKKS